VLSEGGARGRAYWSCLTGRDGRGCALNPTLTLIYPNDVQAKLFKAYIELELQLGAIERVRKLYQKFLEWAPETCAAWCKFAELERDLNEKARPPEHA